MLLVVGSINVDLIVPVPRLPHPGETVLGGDYTLVPGVRGRIRRSRHVGRDPRWCLPARSVRILSRKWL